MEKDLITELSDDQLLEEIESLEEIADDVDIPGISDLAVLNRCYREAKRRQLT